jgi:hypothetical protein
VAGPTQHLGGGSVNTCGDSGGRKVNGDPCPTSFGLNPDSGLCYMHDPERAEEAQAARSRGGKATAGRMKRGPVEPPAALVEMQDAVAWASWTADAVARGQIDTRTAREISTAIKEFRASVEKAGLVAKLKAAEATIAQLQKKAGNR